MEKLEGGVEVIKVGEDKEKEMKEKKDRVEEELNEKSEEVEEGI